MDKMFTLSQFVYFAKQFLTLEEVRLKGVYQEDSNHKKDLSRMLDRLDELEEWFGKRCQQYLAIATTDAKWQEAALLCALDRVADSGLVHDQAFAQKTKRSLQIQKHMVYEQKKSSTTLMSWSN